MRNTVQYEELRRIADLEENDQCLGCDEESVERLENILNVKFPDVYRQYLKEYNGGDFYNYTFTLFSVPHAHNHVSASDSLGFNNMPGTYEGLSVPKKYLKIGVFNFGDLICLDPKSGEVYQWDVENDDVYLECEDFLDFLRETENDFLRT